MHTVTVPPTGSWNKCRGNTLKGAKHSQTIKNLMALKRGKGGEGREGFDCFVTIIYLKTAPSLL